MIGRKKVVSTIHKGTKINFTTKNGDKKTGEVKFLLGGAYRVFDGTEFFHNRFRAGNGYST